MDPKTSGVKLGYTHCARTDMRVTQARYLIKMCHQHSPDGVRGGRELTRSKNPLLPTIGGLTV